MAAKGAKAKGGTEYGSKARKAEGKALRRKAKKATVYEWVEALAAAAAPEAGNPWAEAVEAGHPVAVARAKALAEARS